METTLRSSSDQIMMLSNDSTPRPVYYVGPSNHEQVATPTLQRHRSYYSDKEAVKSITSSPSDTGITSAFLTVPGTNTPPMNGSDSSENEATPRPPFTQSTGGGLHNVGHSGAQCPGDEGDSVTQCPRDGDLITQPQHRANSSLSTVSMSIVPEYMSAGQLLSPRGLSATSKLFESASSSASAKVYALRGEEVNVGLGITSVNVLDELVECDDIYEYCHSEESGGIPVMVKPKKKRGGKKRRRDEKDIDGNYVAIDHYHLDEDYCSSEDEDNDNEGIAQGGVTLDLPALFPKFDDVAAALLEAAGGLVYTMPIGPTIPGTMEYIQTRRRRRC